jgi:hypothetical protein
LEPEPKLRMDFKFGLEFYWSEFENSDEDIDTDEFEAMMHTQGYGKDKAPIVEPFPIPVIGLVTESDCSDDKVEILEPPPIPVVDLYPDSEDEVALLSTPLLGDIVPMVTSEDLESEAE